MKVLYDLLELLSLNILQVYPICVGQALILFWVTLFRLYYSHYVLNQSIFLFFSLTYLIRTQIIFFLLDERI